MVGDRARRAELYRTWIANRKRLETIIAQMQEVSADACEILLSQSATHSQPR